MQLSVTGWLRVIVLALAAVVVVIAMFQNGGQTLNFLFWPNTATWIGILIVALIGFASGLLAATFLRRRRQGGPEAG